MNILFVSALLPWPLVSGGQVRMYNLLKRLSAHHSISLFTYLRKPEEAHYLQNLPFLHDVSWVMRGSGKQAKYILGSFLSGSSVLTRTYQNSTMKHMIGERLAKGGIDLVHIEPFYVYGGIPQMNIPLVVAEHNIEYDVYEHYAKEDRGLVSVIKHWDAKKVRLDEEAVWKKAAGIIAVSDSDAQYIREYVPKTPVTVVPNGVDMGWFIYSFHSVPAKPRFLFVGNFLWHPNRDALSYTLETVWPKILAVYPGAQLCVVGHNPPAGLRDRHITAVVWKERVEDIRDAMKSSDVLLAPMRIAGGSKYKILESMAAGLPVLTTPEGISGLGEEARKCTWVARSLDDYGKLCKDMIDHPKQTEAICRTARTFVETRYDWDNLAGIEDTVWRSVYEKHSTKAHR